MTDHHLATTNSLYMAQRAIIQGRTLDAQRLAREACHSAYHSGHPERFARCIMIYNDLCRKTGTPMLSLIPKPEPQS